MNEIVQPPLTRREAIKKTVLFSSGLLAAGWLERLAAEPRAEFSDKGLHFLAFGDFGSGNEHQEEVADQMAAFAKKLAAPLAAVLALGDNFYRTLTPDRFQRHFEDMYPKADFNCPFYACLGNHDYGPKYDGNQGRPKAQMQLDYARNNPASRWKMPNRWYAVELPDAGNPLVKIIFLDGNFTEGALTPQEKLEQKRFLEAELKKETRAPWRWMITHFPMFSDGAYHGGDKIEQLWGEQLKAGGFSLYLSGHDHNLQHLQVENQTASFVVSGGGGAALYGVKPTDRGYAKSIRGFTHIHVTPAQFDLQHIDAEGRLLHAFRRTPDGKVTVTSRA